MTTDALDRVAHRVLAPLDGLRAELLRAFGRTLAPLLSDRARRVTTLGGVSVVVAFAMTLWMPLVLLALGPIVLGVPHLVADMRYLVVRRGLHRRAPVMFLVVLPLVASFFVPTLELAGLATFGAALAARGSALRRGLVACIGLGIGFVGLRTGYGADVVFAHLHNVIAIALWWWIRPRDHMHAFFVPALVLVLATVLVFFGTTLLTASAFTTFASVLPFSDMATTLSPFDDPQLAEIFVLLFAFGQAVHYAVWLRLMPEDARARRAPRGYTSSYASLRSELGAMSIVVATTLTFFVIAWAMHDVTAARDGYLRFALFHGPLEVALAGLAFAEARRP